MHLPPSASAPNSSQSGERIFCSPDAIQEDLAPSNPSRISLGLIQAKVAERRAYRGLTAFGNLVRAAHPRLRTLRSYGSTTAHALSPPAAVDPAHPGAAATRPARCRAI